MFLNNKLIVLILVIVLSWIGIIGIFLEKEFTSNEYVVKVSYCNSEKSDTISFTTKGGEETIHTYREAVPVLQIGKKMILNVCEYEIISKKIK
jgi:uncharacterized protein (UPF0333 family)